MIVDARINGHGYMIGSRSDHVWAAREARHNIDQARWYRAQGDMSAARFYLREAARWRRSFADRITPAG